MTEQIITMDRTATWSAIGKSVTDCKDVQSVLETSGLNYEVTKEQLFIENPMDPEMRIYVPNRFVTIRDTDNHIYDVVSDKYEVIQNREAFDFVNYIGEEFSFEKVGETDSGMVYVIGKLPDVSILEDTFTPHVIFQNGFNGKINIKAAICPLRIVCQNQFNFAFEDAQNAMTIRHVNNAQAKLQDAREILKLSADYMKKLNATAEHYATMKLTKERVEKIIDYLFPLPDEEKINSYKKNRLEIARAAIISAYHAEDNQNFRGTAWGMINAYTDFITHQKPMGAGNKEESKFISVSLRTPMNHILTAINVAA